MISWADRLPEEELDRVLERAGEKGARLSLTAYNKQRLGGFTGRRTARAPTHEKVKAYLDGLIRERATAAMIDLREIEGPWTISSRSGRVRKAECYSPRTGRRPSRGTHP